MSRYRLRFERTPEHGPVARSAEPRLARLGSWLITDVADWAPDCLEVLAIIEDVWRGRVATESWSGNGYLVDFSPDNVRIRDIHGRHPTDHSLAEAHDAALAYWRFLRPDGAGDVRYRWELEHGWDHPCRDHL